MVIQNNITHDTDLHMFCHASHAPVKTESGSFAAVRNPYGGILHYQNTDHMTAVQAHGAVVSLLGGAHLRLVCCHVAVSQISAVPPA